MNRRNVFHGEKSFMRGGESVAEKRNAKLPRIETEKKIGNTTYIVSCNFAPKGVTVSETIRRMLDRESKRKS